MRGRLFAGRLFEGRLFGAQSEQPTPESAQPAHTGGGRSAAWRREQARIERTNTELMTYIMAFVGSGCMDEGREHRA